MALHTRQTLPELVKQCPARPAGVYLFVGDRYLCRQAAEKLSAALLADGGTEHVLDGDEEDAASLAARLRSLSLLPGRQIYRVTDTRLFHSKKVAKGLWSKVLAARDAGDRELHKRLAAFLAAAGLDPKKKEDDPAGFSPAEWKKTFGFDHPGGDLAWLTALFHDLPPGHASTGGDQTDILLQTLQDGIPANNILFLLAEEVDKRKKFYKYLKKKQVIIDLGVEQGAGAKAQKAQKSVLVELIDQTLAEMGKTMTPGIMEQLLERVGFYPVAVVMETEKLCLSLGRKRRRIELADLEALVGRTRQDALFELTGALGKRELAQALVLLGRLLDNGIHPLAIIATLRNFARKLLLFRALQGQPQYGYSTSMPAQVFQQECLPRLKQNERWQNELKAHPYALYMQFQTAASFPLRQLQTWPGLILSAELRLKGSPTAPETILHHLLHSMLA